MSFSLFFTIMGIVFTVFSSIIIKDIYDYYPINRFTEFLNPTEDTVFNKISICVIPILAWSIIECIALGYNSLFLIGLILNITINCSICYIIHYGNNLLTQDEEKVVSIITIALANIVGFLINYLILLIGSYGNMINSIIGLALLIILFILIRVLKPNILIFKSQKK